MKILTFVLPACLVFALFWGNEEIFSQTTLSNTGTISKAAVKGITTARAIAMMEALLGLTSIIIGFRAKRRSKKYLAKTALILGLTAIVFAVAHLITVSGAVFGSGSGKAGSIIAIILAVVGCLLGWFTFRSPNNG